MDRFSLSFLFLFSLLLLSSALALSTIELDADEPLIRQVVSSDDGADDHELLDADHHFSVFKSKFGKTYATQEEHDYRFGVFKANLRRAKRHQMLDPPPSTASPSSPADDDPDFNQLI